MLQSIKICVENKIQTCIEDQPKIPQGMCRKEKPPCPNPQAQQEFQEVAAGTTRCQSAPAQIAAGEHGRIWGDPHFEGGDGDRFDVQGEAGKTYNLLTDTGMVLNGKFEAYGNDKTVLGSTGLTLSGPKGVSQIRVSARPQSQVQINGVTLQPGQSVPTADGGTATLNTDGYNFMVKTHEGYALQTTIKNPGNNGELEIKVSTPTQGVATDNRLPSGLLGQTFDADKTSLTSADSQGKDAINGTYQDYEMADGIFGNPSPQVAPQATNLHGFYQFAQGFGINPNNNFAFPDKNPLTMTPINWSQEISQSNLDSLNRQTLRKEKEETLSDNSQINRLTHLFSLALQSGNISLAMMLFSHLEARSANKVTKALMEKVQNLQEHKRQLSEQIQTQNNDADGSKNIQKIKTDMESASDDISVLQTFIREVAQNKQGSMELANAFLNKEHETTMDIVRSFGH